MIMDEYDEDEEEEEEGSNKTTDIDTEIWNKLHVVRHYLFYLSSVLYVGVCFTLLAFNSLLISNEAKNMTDTEQVRTFHLIEFFAPFVYTLFILLAIFRPIVNIKKWGRLTLYSSIEQTSLYFQCLTSITAALLIYVAQEEFETIAHNLEYTSLLCQSVVDIMLLVGATNGSGNMNKTKLFLWRLVSSISIFISIFGTIGLFIMRGLNMEFTTHYLEFSMEIILTFATVIAVCLH